MDRRRCLFSASLVLMLISFDGCLARPKMQSRNQPVDREEKVQQLENGRELFEDGNEELRRQRREIQAQAEARAFLKRFGYLPRDESHDIISVKRAVRDIQQMNDLDVTGELDDKTIRMRRAPKCVVPDPFPTKRDTSGTQGLPQAPQLSQDAITMLEIPPKRGGPQKNLKYRWLDSKGNVHTEKADGRLEVAATLAIGSTEYDVGTAIVRRMTQHMPSEVFAQLASKASVGLFTSKDKTTIFPEYVDRKDRPECQGQGSCKGACSDTCVCDGRKYDSLPGVGGVRTTCVDDNFMCTTADPMNRQHSVLVHEFGHTIHLFVLRGISDYYDRVSAAYKNAHANKIWYLDSYAMTNELEYFAEATGVFFNANIHPTSSGGMNSCGRQGEFCKSEVEARNWLEKKDPKLFDVLSFAFTDRQPSLPSGLSVCTT